MTSSNYRVYVLRLRKMMNGNRPKWAITISSPDSETAHHFTSICAMNLFIEQEMNAQDEIQLLFEPQQKGDL